jgi:tRNA/rRNA methyltransferase
MNIVFVLVKPKTPENVGACARAMHTMGFGDMRLVNPCDHLSDRARWLAHGAEPLLEKARIFQSVEEALRGIDFTIGTTARRRHELKHLYHPIGRLPEMLKAKEGAVKHAALLFGCEGFGLTNGELALCDIVTYVPMAQAQPSLNLAQAVMIYAWEFSQLTPKRNPPSPAKPAEGQYLALRRRLEKLLPALDVRPEGVFYRKMMKRVGLSEKTDIRLLHFLCQRVEALIPRARPVKTLS